MANEQRKKIVMEKRSIEEQVADLQVRVACLEISRLAETIEAQASWINELEERIRKLEKELNNGE